MATIIEVDEVNHTFVRDAGERSRVEVLSSINLDVHEGEFVALVGPSGCGKSTLLNMMAGLIPVLDGQVRMRGKVVRGPDASMNVGYMFARDGLMPWRTTVRNVAFGLEIRGDKRASEKAEELMALVGLRGFEHHYRSELSQGMRQRAALARTLSTDPDILLLDEPFGALDAQTKVLVEEEFLRIREERGSTTVFVTHDLMEAITLADRVIVMSARPARIKAEVHIDIPRPRSLTETRLNPVAIELYGRLWEELKVEAERSSEQGD